MCHYLKEATMAALRNAKRTWIELSILSTILLLAALPASAQIRVGGVTIPTGKRSAKKKADQPTTSDTTASDSATKSEPGTKTETPATGTTASNGAAQGEPDFRITFFIKEIAKAKEEVESYTPADKMYLVSAGASSEWLLRAVSPRARQEFLTKWSETKGVNTLVPPLDNLNVSAAKMLPTYKPNPAGLAVHNPVEERMMKATLENLSSLTILKIGLYERAWLIDKNDLGIPTARYKHGHIWARDKNDDHQFCHVYSVNIIQDYAGGGTYGESYARLIEDTLFGCP
jgi:hypothetical protein